MVTSDTTGNSSGALPILDLNAQDDHHAPLPPAVLKRVLFIWLPVSPIFPVGIGYLVNWLHRMHPEVEVEVLDMTQIEENRYQEALFSAIDRFKPDLLAYSWRDVQIFAPHEGDNSLRRAFEFYYAPKISTRIRAAIDGVRMVWKYRTEFHRKLRLIRSGAKRAPNAVVMVGGGAFSVFAEQIIPLLPEGVIGVVGEGEDALIKVVEGRSCDDDRVIYRKNGKTVRGKKEGAVQIRRAPYDLSYVEKVFPGHEFYHRRMIGIQTKRGCPYGCSFCLYTYIEGKRVFYRDPEDVVSEMRQYYEKWGIRNFWFADAQFIPGVKAIPEARALLEAIRDSGMKITWSGYIRTSLISPDLASLMVESGMGDLEVSITSGSQEILDSLRMGFKLSTLIEGCRNLQEAGYKGNIILNYSLNAPGETEETLREAIDSYRMTCQIFGEDRVYPMVFFLAVQPHTAFEKKLIREGYLSSDYDPIDLNPMTIRKLLYNPGKLGALIARACLAAWDEEPMKIGRAVMRELDARLGPSPRPQSPSSPPVHPVGVPSLS
ncbi:MAG: radical SAM protein [Nitrospiraceae bacterium]|nr:radical SAM protein [Nitrospiraceae bacterium]